LRRLLRLDGFLEPEFVEPLARTMLAGKEVPWWEFRCQRESSEGRRQEEPDMDFESSLQSR